MGNCAYQIGFTKAIYDTLGRESIIAVTGASGGIFTAYGVAANKLDAVEHLYRKVDISKKIELFWHVFAGGLISDYVDSLLAPDDYLDIPMCFPVCYLPIFSTRYYDIRGGYNRLWKKHMVAAVNFPFLKIFPSFLHGRFAIDGGSVDNIPLYPLLRTAEVEKPDAIFVLHFDAQYDYRKLFDAEVPIIDLDLSICNGFKKARYDFSRRVIDERIGKSYEYGIDVCEKIFGGDGTRQSIRTAADALFLAEHAARSRNLSCDRLVSILNSLGRLFRSDANCMKKLF